MLLMNLPGGKTRKCRLQDLLYVPNLSYNLFSVSKASEAGKVSSLYFLNCQSCEQASVAVTKEDFWHSRYLHLCTQSLRKLAVDGLVDGFDFDGSKQVSFRESCAEGKLHRSPFPVSGGTHAKEPLNLVHTDVCGKLYTESVGGAEYFLTFTDDRTRYVSVNFLRNMDDMFTKLLELKALVEKSSSRRLNVLWSDNDG